MVLALLCFLLCTYCHYVMRIASHTSSIMCTIFCIPWKKKRPRKALSRNSRRKYVKKRTFHNGLMRFFFGLHCSTFMIQYKARHNDPSQQFNMKMAAFPNGCGHFPIYVTLRKWYNNRGYLHDRPHSRLTLGLQCGHFLCCFPAFLMLYYWMSLSTCNWSNRPLLSCQGRPLLFFMTARSSSVSS